MKNGENKTSLIEIISEVIVDNGVKAIKLLQTEVMYISRYQETICITERSATQAQELLSNNEEADTKVISIHYMPLQLDHLLFYYHLRQIRTLW